MIYQGDCISVLKTLWPKSVDTCVTSPPYWGLRDYGVDGQIGREESPEAFVKKMVDVFRAVKRVLKDDGTLWLNLGDSYSHGGSGGCSPTSTLHDGKGVGEHEKIKKLNARSIARKVPKGLKPKDLVGIPWKVAFALQKDGWYLRSDIIWSKPNPMPESVLDRPTKSHEYIFLLSKSPNYYYDHETIKEPALHTNVEAFPSGWATGDDHTAIGHNTPENRTKRKDAPKGSFEGKHGEEAFRAIRETRNKRSVWEVATYGFSEAHFATFPPALIKPCILAGCPRDGTVLDPFFGAGTTGLVALQNSRNFIGIEINPEYIKIAEKRLKMEDTTPTMFD